MDSVTDNMVDPIEQTKIAHLSTADKDRYLTVEYLVIVRQNRRLVKVFRPQDKNLTFGRSSRCSITLSDPRFSRMAGEIVLGPVPILRRYSTGEKNSEYIPFLLGKSYRIRPYTLTLMEQGDFILNRSNRNIGSKTWLLMSALIILAISGMGSTVLPHLGTLDMGARQEQTSVSTSVVSEQNMEERIVQLGKVSSDDMEIQKIAASESFSKKKISASESTPGNLTPAPPRKKAVAVLIQQDTEIKSRKVPMNAHNLNKAIKTAELLIEKGNLKMACLSLSPLLPHADNDQRRIIINTLDPPMKILFQKAYMLKPYEPWRSTEILKSIVENGLDILPSYWRARRLLDIERSSMSGDLNVDK